MCVAESEGTDRSRSRKDDFLRERDNSCASTTASSRAQSLASSLRSSRTSRLSFQIHRFYRSASRLVVDSPRKITDSPRRITDSPRKITETPVQTVAEFLPCPSTFYCVFFKPRTTVEVEGIHLPRVDRQKPRTRVTCLRLLYTSDTVWYVLFLFNGKHWVGMRPHSGMEASEQCKWQNQRSKDADMEENFDWEPLAQTYMMARVCKMEWELDNEERKNEV